MGLGTSFMLMSNSFRRFGLQKNNLVLKFLVATLFVGSVGFVYGLSVAVWHIFPYSEIANTYKALDRYLAGFDKSNALQLSDPNGANSPEITVSRDDKGSRAVDLSFLEGRVYGSSLLLPGSISTVGEASLNNFNMKWGRIESPEMYHVGASSFSDNKVWFINQKDTSLLERLGLLDLVGAAGGIKSHFSIQGVEFAYIAYIDGDCASARIYNLESFDIALQMPCIPSGAPVDLGGVGGGWVAINNDEILFSTGAPTMSHVDSQINRVAQDTKNWWGKSLNLKYVDGLLEVSVFTVGHRNIQGMAIVDDLIYSVEHGPRGGDELNVLKMGVNYGWPMHSFGSEYDLSQINKDLKNPKRITGPLYSFVPSIGISDVGACPESYAKYYAPNLCTAVSSLIGNSIYFIVHDGSKVFFTEVINLGSRIRKFKFIGDKLIAITDFEGAIVGKLSLLKEK
jgi:hypothetical protein